MMDLGSSMGIPFVSQGRMKCCFNKSKTRRQLLCCSKNLVLRLFLVVFTSYLLSHPFIRLHFFL